MGNTFYFEWEVKLMEAIQAALGSFGAKVASFISNFGEELILIVILGFMYWCWDKRTGKGIGLNIIMGVTYNPILKNIALRQGVLICCITHEMETEIPAGDSSFSLGDTVIVVVSAGTMIMKLNDIFEA